MFKRLLKVKLKVIGIGVISLIMVQIISAYFFGVIAEKQIDYQFKQLTKSKLIKVVKYDYVRGWFHATNQVTLEVNNQVLNSIIAIIPGSKPATESSLPFQAYQLSYTTKVTHGLFAGWLNGSLLPTIAYANTELQLPEQLNKMLTTFFNGKQPLEIANIIYLNKSGKFSIYSPDFNYEEALSGVKVKWGGLKSSISYDNSFNQFTTELAAPNFALVAPTKGELQLKNLSYSANSRRSLNDLKVGLTEMALESLLVNWNESAGNTFKLGEAVHALTGINSVEFLNSIDAINPNKFSIADVSYKSDSQDQDGYFAAKVLANVEHLSSNGESYGPMVLNLSLNHILSDKFSSLADAIESAATSDQGTPDERRERLISDLKSNLIPIFAANPLVAVNQFSLMTPSGEIKLTGQATMRGFTASDMESPTDFLSRLNLTANFSVPKSVLAYYFILQMKYFLTAGNAQMDKQSSDALAKVVNILLDNQLQVWLKKGYLIESNNQLSTTVRIESGVTTLNGIITK